MGCVQLKQHQKKKFQQESMQFSTKQMVNLPSQRQKQTSVVVDDPQVIRSLSNISDERKVDKHGYQIRSSSSSKQTGVGETMKLDDPHSKSHISSKVAPKYPVTLEYVLARKSFVENQNIPQEHRLNMFPAPKLKGIERSSLYYRRKSTNAEIMRPRKFEQVINRPSVKSQKF